MRVLVIIGLIISVSAFYVRFLVALMAEKRPGRSHFAGMLLPLRRKPRQLAAKMIEIRPSVARRTAASSASELHANDGQFASKRATRLPKSS